VGTFLLIEKFSRPSHDAIFRLSVFVQNRFSTKSKVGLQILGTDMTVTSSTGQQGAFTSLGHVQVDPAMNGGP
jgi:hypothetical protein